MNYTELCALVQDTVESTFTTEQLANFAQQTEQKVFNFVQPPVLRENSTGTLTQGSPYLTLPNDFLYVFSLAVISAAGVYSYVLVKDVNYVRAAYPNPADQGTPKVYAQFDENTLILGPSPDQSYTVELHYAAYPASISTAGTSWLGDNYDSVLFNGMLVEAARFLKLEADTVTLYSKMFDEALAGLKQLADGKQRQDTFRTGQVRNPVR